MNKKGPTRSANQNLLFKIFIDAHFSDFGMDVSIFEYSSYGWNLLGSSCSAMLFVVQSLLIRSRLLSIIISGKPDYMNP